MPKEKVTAEERIEAAKACAEGRMSQAKAARRCGRMGVSRPLLPDSEQRKNPPAQQAGRKPKFSDRARDLTGTQAAGAGVDITGAAVHNCLDPDNIRFPSSV